MTALQTLGFALGASFASGLNLYATIAALGLFHRYGVIHLPPSLEVLAHPVVLGVTSQTLSTYGTLSATNSTVHSRKATDIHPAVTLKIGTVRRANQTPRRNRQRRHVRFVARRTDDKRRDVPFCHWTCFGFGLARCIGIDRPRRRSGSHVKRIVGARILMHSLFGMQNPFTLRNKRNKKRVR